MSTTFKLVRVAVLVGLFVLPACSAPELCTAPSEKCACTSPSQGDTALVVLTDKASPAFSSAMARMTAAGSKAFANGRLGLDGKPTVIVATYDAIGAIHELGSFNLAGEADSASRKAANAKLQGACLVKAAAEVPADGSTKGNLLRALPSATALAKARGSAGAAVLAFGLGRSSVEGLELDKIDLGSPEARRKVIQELSRVGILGAPQPVAVTFVDPAEGIESGITAGFLNTFVEGDLCAALTKLRCQRVEVLA